MFKYKKRPIDFYPNMQRKSGMSEDFLQLKGSFSLWVPCLGVQALGFCKARRERFDCSSFNIINEINWEKEEIKGQLDAA